MYTPIHGGIVGSSHDPPQDSGEISPRTHRIFFQPKGDRGTRIELYPWERTTNFWGRECITHSTPHVPGISIPETMRTTDDRLMICRRQEEWSPADAFWRVLDTLSSIGDDSS